MTTMHEEKKRFSIYDHNNTPKNRPYGVMGPFIYMYTHETKIKTYTRHCFMSVLSRAIRA